MKEQITEENSKAEEPMTSTGELPDETLHTDDARPAEINSEWLKSNTEIRGWLSFFIFSIIASGLISAIYPIATYNAADYAGFFCLEAGDIVPGLILLGIAGYTVYAFRNRKPNAVFWGKAYVLLALLINLVSLACGATEESGMQSTTHVVRSCALSFAWFLYLTFSAQVEEVMPKSFRRISSVDWAVLAASVLLPASLFGVGYVQVTSMAETRQNQETAIRSIPLAENQRTDGRVIFTVPEGVVCESRNVDVEGINVTVFDLSIIGTGEITICSDYDSDKSAKNFDDYWENWKNANVSLYRTEEVERGRMEVNGNDCLYRIIKITEFGRTEYWQFHLLFDDETGKVFIASFHDSNNASHYVTELLESVRFK